MLGEHYKTRLQLQTKEVNWLNKFNAPGYAFLYVEVARKSTVQLYLAVLHELEAQFKKAGLTLQKEVKKLDLAVRSHHYRDYRNYLSLITAGNRVGAAVHLTIFQRCENVVRAHLGSGLLVEDGLVSHLADTPASFAACFGDAITAFLPTLPHLLPALDEETELALNQYDTTRWRFRFEQLSERLPADPAGFTAGMHTLGQQNARNSALALLYREAAWRLGDLNREATIGFYFRYLHHGAGPYNFKPKPLPKRLQKKLFPLQQHFERFEEMAQQLLRRADLAPVLAHIPDIYYQERRKIELNMGAVQAARQQHTGTVNLLNSYLQDVSEPEKAVLAPALTTAKARPTAPAAIPQVAGRAGIRRKAAGSTPLTAAPASIFVAGLRPSAAQEALLLLFAAHNLALPQAKVEAFAKAHGTFRNQLIDGLNDACYPLLDDVLIEEDGADYTIYEPHYQKITV